LNEGANLGAKKSPRHGWYIIHSKSSRNIGQLATHLNLTSDVNSHSHKVQSHYQRGTSSQFRVGNALRVAWLPLDQRIASRLNALQTC